MISNHHQQQQQEPTAQETQEAFNHREESESAELEIKQLLAERGIYDDPNIPRKDSTGGILATALRILKSMDSPNYKNQTFFTITEIGRYDSGFAISSHIRTNFINKAKKLGWVKEITLPQNLGNGRKRFDDKEINTILFDEHTEKSIKKLRNTKFYKITDEGRRVYKNLLEVYEKLSSSSS